MCNEEGSLHTDQEEAGTKMFLCSQHAKSRGMTSVCINAMDSDIALYALYFKDEIEVNMDINIGVTHRKRIIIVSNIALEIGRNCCLALPALHAFMGYDYTCAFHGIGKVKAFKPMKSSIDFQMHLNYLEIISL